MQHTGSRLVGRNAAKRNVMTLNERIIKQLDGMDGWCDPAKAIRMAEYVLQDKPEICVEIGVFAGKSAISTAFALQQVGRGHLYAIDSWAASDCLVDVPKEDADWWANNVQLEDIFKQFVKHVATSGVESIITVMKSSSADSGSQFTHQIDMLHIDGCHSEWSSTSDVCLWLPKVKSGGLVVMDDVNWPGTQTAVRFVEKFCDRLEILNAKESVCGFFRKR